MVTHSHRSILFFPWVCVPLGLAAQSSFSQSINWVPVFSHESSAPHEQHGAPASLPPSFGHLPGPSCLSFLPLGALCVVDPLPHSLRDRTHVFLILAPPFSAPLFDFRVRALRQEITPRFHAYGRFARRPALPVFLFVFPPSFLAVPFSPLFFLAKVARLNQPRPPFSPLVSPGSAPNFSPSFSSSP